MSIAVVYLKEEFLDISLMTSTADKDFPIFEFSSLSDAKKADIPSGYSIGCAILKDGYHVFSNELGLDFIVPIVVYG